MNRNQRIVPLLLACSAALLGAGCGSGTGELDGPQQAFALDSADGSVIYREPELAPQGDPALFAYYDAAADATVVGLRAGEVTRGRYRLSVLLRIPGPPAGATDRRAGAEIASDGALVYRATPEDGTFRVALAPGNPAVDGLRGRFSGTVPPANPQASPERLPLSGAFHVTLDSP